jgi:hypothetical protein
MSEKNVEVLRTAYAQAAARRVDCEGVTHSRGRGSYVACPDRAERGSLAGRAAVAPTRKDGSMKLNVGQPTAEIPNIGITIRRLGADDNAAVTRLAQLDTARRPRGELIGAELDGHLVAAISTTTSEAIADPFRRTAEIVEMLRVRLTQLNARPTFRTRLMSLLRPARAALRE